MKAAVVGAGIMGASTALALTDRGHKVTIFEQFPLGHTQGSSHGRSRIIRRAYPDPFYTAIMQEGYPLWAELQDRVSRRLVFECGLVYFGSERSENVQSMIDALQALGVPHSVLDPSAMRDVFPDLSLTKDEVGVFTPEAGWVDASGAVGASIALARDGGAEFVEQRIVSPMELLDEFDHVIVCGGAWLTKWFSIGALVNLQTFGYVRVSTPHRGPVWIEDSPPGFYGFPSEPLASTVKIGVHRAGPQIDPDDPDRTHNDLDIEAIREFARRRFGVSEPEIAEAMGCLYTARSDEDFRFGQVDERLIWASPCSGHGFKFGPWVGRFLADVAEERRSLVEYPRFLAA